MMFVLGTAKLHQDSNALLKYFGPRNPVDIGQVVFVQEPDDIGIELRAAQVPHQPADEGEGLLLAREVQETGV